MIRYFFLLSVGHILVSYKSLGPKVNGAPAVNKMNGDQAEETAPTPALKLPDSEDEHNEDDTERNVEVAKVKSHTVKITRFFLRLGFYVKSKWANLEAQNLLKNTLRDSEF